MFWEKKLANWIDTVRSKTVIPLRLQLWNGSTFDFSPSPPEVTLTVPHVSALRYLLNPSLSNLGEAYVEGKIQVAGPVKSIIRIANLLASQTLQADGKLARITRSIRHSKASDAEAIHYHYDVSNAFYSEWLDSNMVYSCAYFENGDEDLASAQLKKIDHILTKIQVRPGDRLLDIGCGWGALVIRAAQKFGAHCVGITLSEKQFELATKRVAAAGLSDLIEIRLQDYRDTRGTFDRITSVGMFEHVGLKNLPAYFSIINNLLAEDGLALNHGITTSDVKNGETPYGGGEFIDHYVFPAGELPHIGTVLSAMQQGGLEALDLENLRRHYAKTCSIWADNFETGSARIKELVDDKLYRIWRVYLAGSAYAFENDWISLYQVVCAKAGRNADTLDWSRRYMYPQSDIV
ncbi:cyclopropane-fatty-acyl-phospholipid synthase family protein [Herbaspirillum sp. RTI4]|uniref:cyclopropane-fatty-acyl-phospholipid synthase family protein n=1 Tax=Herbaspirillum sp. RTI4 TaxID=3048640 RepID=UPI002AB36D05|nr:cyclopropane-fatty-acyl-phospholipid synthase family protein [Herbaspirillum sp. RTI4]MDY7576788.1 cyclopropane-fatty-acyl-phospholipid synthase family protein [Herbaspirillum sp. RTI4]MEA9981384.1 cyclopropane-fatty-acyl-phospholipid synthase family protein [Herbaspirillum sp. RTI4]